MVCFDKFYIGLIQGLFWPIADRIGLNGKKKKKKNHHKHAYSCVDSRTVHLGILDLGVLT